MQTTPDCLDCFRQQALTAARLSSNDPAVHRHITQKTDSLISLLDMSFSPPENAGSIYKLIADLSGVKDPFAAIKKESNSFALQLRDTVLEKINSAGDPLFAAVRYAIAGNIIDYGVQHEFDAMRTLAECLEKVLFIDDYHLFKKGVTETGRKNILYLADNCGEIVFDALLIEQLKQLGHTVTLATRGDEILNDVTLQDAQYVGLGDMCRIITNGSSCPGTPLGTCGEKLREAYSRADLIISKGQGNFETLSEERGPIYFLLTVKCAVVARHICELRNEPGAEIIGSGEMILMKKEE